MKTLNKTRRTNQFNICGVDVDHIAAIGLYAASKGWQVVGLANDAEDTDGFRYTVRALASGAVTDFLLEVVGRDVRMLDQREIVRAR